MDGGTRGLRKWLEGLLWCQGHTGQCWPKKVVGCRGHSISAEHSAFLLSKWCRHICERTPNMSVDVCVSGASKCWFLPL